MKKRHLSEIVFLLLPFALGLAAGQIQAGVQSPSLPAKAPIAAEVPAPIDVSPDGELVLLFLPGGQGFEIVNTRTGERDIVSPTPHTGYFATISPSKEFVCFKDFQPAENGKLLQMPVLFDIAAKKQIRLSDPAPAVGNPVISSKGQIAFTVGSELIVLRPDLSPVTKIDLGAVINVLTFSPDGRSLAFGDENEKVSHLDLATQKRSSVPAAVQGFQPRFSPDGKALLARRVNGEITACNLATGVSKNFGRAQAAAWVDSDTVALVQKTVSNFSVTSTRLTHRKLSNESSSVLFSRKGNAGFALSHSALASTADEGLSLGDVRTGLLQKNSVQLRPAPVAIPATEVSKAAQVIRPKTLGTNSNTVQMSGMPYINQVYDTSDDFDGSSACNATSTLMAIQYYNRLPTHPITCHSGGTHTSQYGFYISSSYSYNGHTFNIPSTSIWGTSLQGYYGGFGFFLQDWTDDSQLHSTRLSQWVADHNLSSTIDNTITYAKIQAEVNANCPNVFLVDITSAGHYITCIGYWKAQHTLVFNDPAGSFSQGYFNWNGAAVSYDYPGYNDGNPNLVGVERFVYCRGIPAITTQPTSRTVNQGNSTTFTVTASGATPLHYQWRFNGGNISGATASSYTLNNAQTSNAGSYSVYVNNSYGNVTSGNAVLTVNVTATAPSITTQPASQTANPGANVTFTVSATGTAPLNYQWRYNGVNISGATASAYTRSNVQPVDVGSYSVYISNAGGNTTSANALLTVNTAGVFTETFESGNMNNWTVLSGATALTISTAQHHGGSDSAILTNSTARMYHNFSPIQGHAWVTFYIYDDSGAQDRAFGDIRGYTGGAYNSGSLAQLLAIGRYGVGFGTNTGTLAGQVVNPANYQGRVVSGANTGWFNLNAARSTGWHCFQIERQADGSTINFYVDGALDSTVTGATYQPFDDVTMGSAGSGSTSGNAWFDDIKVEYLDAPTITTQPASQTVIQGSSATFSVVATGNVTAYQWKFNGATISGATASSYTLNNVQSTNAGSYTVQVSNAASSVTSAAAILTVNSNPVAPAITTQPASQTVNPGANATFTVTASGTAPLYYQWTFNGANISGATASSYTKSNIQATDAGSYAVVVTNSVGSATSANAVLTVNTPPTITTQPQSQTVAGAANATFSVTASGTAPLSYQWTFNGGNISGATASAYTRNNVGAADCGSYAVVVSNVAGNATSASAVLTVSVPPLITKQPISQTIASGSNVTFSVTAAGASPLSYQWQFNQQNISGGTASAYTINNSQSSNLGAYTVVVNNAYGSVTSSNAILTFVNWTPFSDDFESGNMNNWTVCASPATALTASTAQHNSGSYSAYLANSMNKMYRSIATTMTGHIKVTFWEYDATGGGGTTGQTRFFGEVRSYSGGSYNNGSLNQLYAIGRYSVAFGTGTGILTNEVLNTTNYQGRVLSGANAGWFNLSGAANRTIGWHKFEIEQFDDGTVDFLVDDVLGREIPGATLYPLDDLSIGSVGTGTQVTADAWFDDVKIQYYDGPNITTQPASQTANAGANATFTVAAVNDIQGYQWRLNGTNIAGATASSLALNNVQQTDAGSYSVVVRNGVAAVPSAIATLTVNGASAPSIATQPASQTVNQGVNATFSVVANGTAPLYYQWTFNGANVSGATLSSYTKSNAQPSDAGSYAVVVTNSLGSATSANATLTVNVPPSITTQPASQTVNQGNNVTFSVTAAGTAPLSYQWTFNGGNISGATSSSYSKSNIQGVDAGSYSVVVTNMAGTVTSANAVLTVNVPPSITTQPASQSVAAGANVTFSVVASGTAPLSYQWKFNGGNIANATASSYSLNNVQSSNAGSYSVGVTNMAGGLLSANATLTVNNPPTLSLSASRATEQVVNFESMTNYGNDVTMFRKPANSGTTSAFIDTTQTNYSMVVTSGIPSGNPNGDGSKALAAGWTFKTGTTNAWLRLTTANPTYIPNPTVSFQGRVRFDIYANNSILLGLGLRETGTTNAAIGSNGGTTGSIEWVGVTNAVGGMPQPTRSIAAATWTTVEVNLPAEPCTAFTGNGVLDGLQGVLEELAIIPNGGLTSYTIYLDNFQMVMTNTLPSTVTMNSGSTLTFTAAGSDPDSGQTLTYSLVSPPSGAGINSSTGAFTWTPSSGGTTNTITVQVTDNGVPALNASQSFSVIVNTDPLGVMAETGSALSASEGALALTWPAVAGTTYQVQFKQADGEWTNLGGPITVSGAEGRVEVSGADQAVTYRVVDLSSPASNQ